MTSFLSTENYTPILVLIIGLATFVGLEGLGAAILRALRVRLPSPWLQVSAVLLGIQFSSLIVQAVGMTHIATRGVLGGVWWGLVVLGGGAALLWGRPAAQDKGPSWRSLSFSGWVPVCVAGAANLLVAMAPSTKIDELYYHMLVPSRIVIDRALLFYREPWPGAILPQMIFQISTAPLHAIGYPDAGNVVSWALSMTLLWFAWRIMGARSEPVGWVSVWMTALIVGLYSVVWHVTAGSHAMGDLAMAAAIVAFFLRRNLIAETGPVAYAALCSILTLASASSKVSLLPLSGAVLLGLIWPAILSARSQERWRVLVAMAAPWVILAVPLMIWTWWKSGSPLGPMLSGVFPSSVYDPDAVRAMFVASGTISRPPLVSVIQTTLLSYSPLLWVGVLGALAVPGVTGRSRLAGCLFLALQILLIYWFLPWEARFLGGVHYGLLVVFAASAPPVWFGVTPSKRGLDLCLGIFLLPWLAAQLYYAAQFFPVSLGLQPKSEFYDRYIAFHSDYTQLDQILPRTAVLLVKDFRAGAVYAPRPVYMDVADLPQDKDVFLLTIRPVEAIRKDSYPGFEPGASVYENPKAFTETYRRPGTRPRIESARVIQLIRTRR